MIKSPNVVEVAIPSTRFPGLGSQMGRDFCHVTDLTRVSLFSRAFHTAPVITESSLSSEGFSWTTRMELPCWRN